MRAQTNVADLLRAFRFPVYLIVGTPRYGGSRLCILYAGNKHLRHYIIDQAYAEPPEEKYFGKMTFQGLRTVARKAPVDIEFCRSHVSLIKAGFFSRRYFIPEWISGETNLSDQAKLERTSSSRRRDIRQLENNNVTYTVTRDSRALRYFYDRMYMPHVIESHGDAALPMSCSDMIERARSASGDLVLILLDGTPVAGSYIVYEDRLARLFSCGVLDKDTALLRIGIGSAIYLFSFSYLLSKGFEKVNMGRSRAFLSDGALYFKQRFGYRFSGASDTGVLLKIHRPTAAARNFLHNTGFLHYRDGEVRAVLFPEYGNVDDDPLSKSKRGLAANVGIERHDLLDLWAQQTPVV